jgi:hypothetical protein
VGWWWKCRLGANFLLQNYQLTCGEHSALEVPLDRARTLRDGAEALKDGAESAPWAAPFGASMDEPGVLLVRPTAHADPGVAERMTLVGVQHGTVTAEELLKSIWSRVLAPDRSSFETITALNERFGVHSRGSVRYGRRTACTFFAVDSGSARLFHRHGRAR